MGDGFICSTSSSIAIESSNIGFQLLKKHGWKEGTGLGVSEQGRLEPLQPYLKNNKRGLGADKAKKKKKKRTPETLHSPASNEKNDKEHSPSKKSKLLSKKQRKMKELEKRIEEKEFERAFLREFWPDNV